MSNNESNNNNNNNVSILNDEIYSNLDISLICVLKQIERLQAWNCKNHSKTHVIIGIEESEIRSLNPKFIEKLEILFVSKFDVCKKLEVIYCRNRSDFLNSFKNPNLDDSWKISTRCMSFA